MLHATKRKPRIGSDHAVDKDAACLQVTNETVAFFLVISPGGRAKPERRGIRQVDRFVERADTKQRGYGSEDFVAISRRIFRDIDQHGWFVKVSARKFAIEFHSLAAGESSRSGPTT